jgi:hypothetical protein
MPPETKPFSDKEALDFIQFHQGRGVPDEEIMQSLSLRGVHEFRSAQIQLPKPPPVQQPVQAKPGGPVGPGFIELPLPKREKEMTFEQAAGIITGNIRRSAPIQERTLLTDLAIKGTATAQATKMFGRTLKRFGRRPTPTGFIVAGTAADVISEIALQEAEIAMGTREKLNGTQILVSGGLTALVGLGATFTTKMIGRIGGLPPLDVKDAAYRGVVEQYKLLTSKASSRVAQRSAEFGEAARLEGAVSAVINPKAFGGSGIDSVSFMLPSAQRNMLILKEHMDRGVRIPLRPAIEFARSVGKSKIAPRKGFKSAASEIGEWGDELFDKFGLPEPVPHALELSTDLTAARAKRALDPVFVDPVTFNKILKELQFDLKQSLQRISKKKGVVVAVTATESQSNRLFLQLEQGMDQLLKDTMGLEFVENAAKTTKHLAAAERIAAKMSNNSLVNLVRTAPDNELLMKMLVDFDELNGTKFAQTAFDINLSRKLTVDQRKAITGLARTVAPFLVIMRQLTTKVAIPLVRPLTSVTGSFVAAGFRGAEAGVERLIDEELARSGRNPAPAGAETWPRR